MARLPGRDHLVQQIGGDVVLFEDHTEREIARANMGDGNAMAKAQLDIHNSDLSPEDKCFAHFWWGYFWAFGAYPEMEMPGWVKTGWPKPEPEPEGPDTSKSFLPGTQWGLNAAYKSGGALSDEDREDVESEFNAWLLKMDELYPGIDFTLIPRPSWETTGLVGSKEDLEAVMADLAAADEPMVTKTGRVLTDDDIDGFVAEAERGYDVDTEPDAANEAYARDCYEDGGYEGPN